MICERDLAGRAARDEAAVATEHDRREPAAVQVEDGLIAVLDRADERGAQRARQRPAVSGAELEPKVDDGGRRQRELAHALRKWEEAHRAGGPVAAMDQASDPDATRRTFPREPQVSEETRRTVRQAAPGAGCQA